MRDREMATTTVSQISIEPFFPRANESLPEALSQLHRLGREALYILKVSELLNNQCFPQTWKHCLGHRAPRTALAEGFTEHTLRHVTVRTERSTSSHTRRLAVPCRQDDSYVHAACGGRLKEALQPCSTTVPDRGG